ncbi:MAG: hypothetical protein L3K00_00790 [Thermoplasmata archaeon]|nr:hypothetical protein [Thermoplasmata archaeon]
MDLTNGTPPPGAPAPPPGATGAERPSESRPAEPAPRRNTLTRFEDTYFPPRLARGSNPTGVREPGKPELYGYLFALAIGLFAVYLVERAMSAYPIPSGGDPGQWISGSYAFIGLPYPNWLLPGQYPPLVFPILGLFVRWFGPLQAGRAFVALGGVGLGLSTYYLSRTLLRSRVVALGVEAFVLLSPTLVQSFFQGIYPTILGLIFLNLSIAFLIRFVRSGSETHVFLFWVATAATVLSQPQTATVLGLTLAVLALFLVSSQQLTRTFYRGRVALAGFAVFVLSVGGFYGLAAAARVPQPHFLAANAFSYVRNGLGSLYYLLLNPYLAGAKPSLPNAELISLLLAGFLAVTLVGLRLLRPRRLSLGTLTVLTMLLAVIGGAYAAWKLSVVTDYPQFAFFLVVPIGLGLGLGLDAFLHWDSKTLTHLLAGVAAPPSPDSPLPPAAGPIHRPTVRRAGPSRRVPAGWTLPGTVVLTLAIVALLLSTALVTEPHLSGYEQANSSLFHDGTFLAALNDIQHSGVSGNVIAPGGAAKWTRALLDREAYTPFVAPRFTFDPGHLTDEEIAYFALVARASVTNSLVAATIAGTNASFDNVTPDYEASTSGQFIPVAGLAADEFNVTLTNGTGNRTESVTASPTIVATPAGPASMALLYPEDGFSLNITIVIDPSLPHAVFSFQFSADPGWSILDVRGNMTGPPMGVAATNILPGPSGGQLYLTPSAIAANLRTFANVTPTSAVGRPQSFNRITVGEVARVPLNVSGGPSGAPSIELTVAFSTPKAENLVDDLPTYLDAPTVWQGWGVRFVLATNESRLIFNHPSAILWETNYLVGEYGASVLAVEGTWTVLLLPAPDG